MILLDGGMPASSIRVDNDRVRGVKGRWILGPAVGIDNAADARNFVEATLEQKAAGAVFVFAGSVARIACDEDDFFLGGKGVGCQRQEADHEKLECFH